MDFYYFIGNCIYLSAKKYKKTILLILAIFSAVLILTNPRFSDFLKKNKYKDKDNNITVNDPRVKIWYNAFIIAKENIFFGVGTGDVEIELHKKLFKNKHKSLSNLNINTHNTFLQEFVRLGLPGIIVFSSIFCGLFL